MVAYTAEITKKEILQTTLRNISVLSGESLLKLAEYTEELIEEQEEAEDIAYINSLSPEDYANAVPFEDVLKEFEALHGPLYQN